MNSRTLVLAAALAVAISGVAKAEGTESPSPQQTTSFFRWLFPEAHAAVNPKPRSVANKLTAAPVVIKPAPTCNLLTCVTLVGVAF
jgi:hypothetical protein